MIRRAVAEDAGALHALAAATFPLACPPGSTEADQRAFIDEHLSVAAFERYLADPDRVILVDAPDGTGAADGTGGAFVGYTMLVVGEPADADVLAALAAADRPTGPGEVAELSKCYVLPSVHGGGVAGALVAATTEIALARGARMLWLGVNEENARAQRFYEKCGFRAVGTKRFLVGDRLEHDHVMAMPLAAATPVSSERARSAHAPSDRSSSGAP